MISIKSPREIKIMMEAGRIVALAHQEVAKHIQPGASTKYLDEVVENIIRENGATPSFLNYGGFPASICASKNNVVVHGIPNVKDVLVEGDIISIDIGANFKGYHGDSAWTYPVGKISKQRQNLLKVTEESLFAGLEKVKAGVKLGEVSNAIFTYASSRGYSLPEIFTGHGIGSELHEDPAIPNFGPANVGPILKAGMVLAIEPMVNIGKKHVNILLDNWTAVTKDKKDSAHFEHTVVVLEDGYEILTKL